MPRVTLEFLVEELLLHRERLDSVQWGNIVAALLSPWLGLGPYFGYYLVTARKRREPWKTASQRVDARHRRQP